MKSGIDQVAHKTYTLTGRSQTALLDAPYALTCSFLQENEVQQDNFAKQNWTSEYYCSIKLAADWWAWLGIVD